MNMAEPGNDEIILFVRNHLPKGLPVFETEINEIRITANHSGNAPGFAAGFHHLGKFQ